MPAMHACPPRARPRGPPRGRPRDPPRGSAQSAEERNYHIFYNLFAGLDKEEKAALHLTEPKACAYLTKGLVHVSAIDDAERYTELVLAMRSIEITGDEQRGVFRAVAALLHLGNIQVEHGVA